MRPRIHISEEASYDLLGIEISNFLEGYCQVKEIATLFSLIERAQLGA
jgi:hypothetical protein